MANKTDKVQDIARMGSDLHTAWAAVKPFLLGRNAGSDADSDKAGTQAHHKGTGRADEALFEAAMAQAKVNLVANKTFSMTAVNAIEMDISLALKELPVQARKDIILDVGLGEQQSTKKDPSGKFGKNGEVLYTTETFMENKRGILICESWLQMTPDQLQASFHRKVNGDEYTQARLVQAEEKLKEINDGMETFFEENTPKTCHPVLDAIPIVNLFFRRK